MSIGKLIKLYREQNKLTMQEFADKAGLSKGYISMLEKGVHPQNDKPIIPSIDTVSKIAKAMNTSIDTLLENTDSDQQIALTSSPLYEAAAGSGRINDGYTDTISLQLNADEVAVAVKGDSMYPVLCDGDIAIVAATSVVRSDGDIMLVKINGDEATLKYVKRDSDGLYLYAENIDAYKRKFFTAKEVAELPVTIEGVVVRFIREMK